MKKTANTPVSARGILVMSAVAAAATALVVLFPERQDRVVQTSARFFVEMISILPAIVILIGLFSVFVPNQLVADHLGKTSGTKGFLLSILMGALPTGPLYVAFPIVSALIKKGASISNMVAFLTAWACIKLPQEMVELRFLGIEFTVLRLVLTIASAACMGYITERVMHALERNET